MRLDHCSSEIRTFARSFHMNVPRLNSIRIALHRLSHAFAVLHLSHLQRAGKAPDVNLGKTAQLPFCGHHLNVVLREEFVHDVHFPAEHLQSILTSFGSVPRQLANVLRHQGPLFLAPAPNQLTRNQERLLAVSKPVFR